jgi:hypothetical protein
VRGSRLFQLRHWPQRRYAFTYVNGGRGVFAPAEHFYSPTNPMQVAFADVDGDGREDAVVTRGASGVTLLTNRTCR